jgi:hypothetical protein
MGLRSGGQARFESEQVIIKMLRLINFFFIMLRLIFFKYFIGKKI